MITITIESIELTQHHLHDCILSCSSWTVSTEYLYNTQSSRPESNHHKTELPFPHCSSCCLSSKDLNNCLKTVLGTRRLLFPADTDVQKSPRSKFPKYKAKVLSANFCYAFFSPQSLLGWRFSGLSVCTAFFWRKHFTHLARGLFLSHDIRSDWF